MKKFILGEIRGENFKKLATILAEKPQLNDIRIEWFPGNIHRLRIASPGLYFAYSEARENQQAVPFLTFAGNDIITTTVEHFIGLNDFTTCISHANSPDKIGILLVSYQPAVLRYAKTVKTLKTAPTPTMTTKQLRMALKGE